MSTEHLSWDQMAAFLAVLRTGSLSGAARQLGMMQPTIRRQIENLEEQLGITLFTRAQNGLTPTPAALGLMAHAEAVESAVGVFRRFASASRSDVSGAVRLTSSVVFGTEILPPILATLLNTYPDLSIELDPTDETEDLLRRDADIAVRLVEPKQGALRAKRVRTVKLGFFATKEVLGRQGTPLDYADLSERFDFIGPDKDRSFRDALAAQGLKMPLRIRYRTDDSLAQLAAIRAGIGIGVSQHQIGERLGLVPVLPEFSLALPCWIVMHEDLKDVARIRVVFDHLVSALA